MREYIARWGKELERRVTAERGGTKFKDVIRQGEYVNVIGHDSSILEIVIGRSFGIFQENIYTRIVWSEQHPKEAPFAFKHYLTAQWLKPKQEFFDDKEFKCRFVTKEFIEKELFGAILAAL